MQKKSSTRGEREFLIKSVEDYGSVAEEAENCIQYRPASSLRQASEWDLREFQVYASLMKGRSLFKEQGERKVLLLCMVPHI